MNKRAIHLETHSPAWADSYVGERDRILSDLADRIAAIEHVGSTAIPGVCARPTVDIAIAAQSPSEAEQLAAELARIGYENTNDDGVPGARIFKRGLDMPTHLVHAVLADSQEWQNCLYFRDALRSNAELVKQYDSLKRALAHKFFDDPRSYTYAKGQFIESVLQSRPKSNSV